MQAIEVCRTSVLGGHLEQCDSCSYQRVAYNSCRNRHCPKCQALASGAGSRHASLTCYQCPTSMSSLRCPNSWQPRLQNKRVVYNLLFSAAAKTLLTIARDPKHLGAEPGFLAVLHTWSQTLRHHPHLHCVVPGGGLSLDGTHWVVVAALLPAGQSVWRVCSAVSSWRDWNVLTNGQLSFYGTTLTCPATRLHSLARSLRAREWWVYAKPPFGGPGASARLSRSLHPSRGHLQSPPAHCHDGLVTFSWKDYARGNQQRALTLSTDEFMRRFLLHVLPRGFQRLRQFGLLANRHRREQLARCIAERLDATQTDTKRLPRDYQSLYKTVTAESLRQCPACDWNNEVD